MTWWIRGLAKRIFGRIMGEAPKEKAFKYMAIARIGYFMSTVTLAVVVLKSKRDYEAQILEQGKPMIEDKSPCKYLNIRLDQLPRIKFITNHFLVSNII